MRVSKFNFKNELYNAWQFTKSVITLMGVLILVFGVIAIFIMSFMAQLGWRW